MYRVYSILVYCIHDISILGVTLYLLKYNGLHCIFSVPVDIVSVEWRGVECEVSVISGVEWSGGRVYLVFSAVCCSEIHAL